MDESFRDNSKGAKIEGERRQLVLVFVDIVGSTELSAQLDSEDFAGLMLEFQKQGRIVFERFGGHVAHYLGDGLLVYFGYPQAQENDSERAVRAAFELLRRLKSVSLGGQAELLQARVGIHTGTVVVGSSGDGLGGVLLGETVNVAARIQSAANPGAVFASEAALQLLKGRFASVAQPPIKLKGVAEQVVLHHVRRPIGNNRTVTAPRVELIGRDADLERLAAAWANAQQSQRTGVTITGDPGVGKTTLVAGFRASLSEAPHIWLEARCDALQTGGALHPFIDLVRKSLGILDHHDPVECAKRLSDGLSVWKNRPPHALPVVANLLGISVPEQALIAAESPESLRGLTLQTLAAWIEYLATLRPVILVCEDLHWSDATTFECFDRLLGRGDPIRFLCILTTRPGHRQLAANRLADQIELSILSDDDARKLVNLVSASTPLDAAIFDRVVERGQGVPLFVEELTRQALRAGADSGEGVPQTLDGLVMQQLDSLPSEVKATAQIAAALGQTFDHELLAAVSELSQTGLEAVIEALLEADVIRRAEMTPPSYVFRHALTRDGAYSTMLRPRRTQIHSAAAKCLMTQFRSQGEKRPAVVAHHLLRSSQFLPAAAWFQSAGRSAARQAAVEDAATLYREALAALKDAPGGEEKDRIELSLQILLGNALMGVRGFGSDEIVPVWERALELAETLLDNDERSSALNGIAVYWIGKGDCAKACEFADKILAWSDPTSHRIGRLRAHSSLANAKFQIGDVAEARDHAELAVSLYRPEDFSNVTYGVGTDQGVVAYGAAAACHWWLGATETGLKRAWAGVALAEGLESALSLAAARSYLAMTLHYRGEEAEAHALADETVSFCDQIGIPFWQGLCLILRAGQSVDPPDKRLSDVEAGLGIMTSAGSQSAVSLGFSIMASAQTADGHVDTALNILKTGTQISTMLGQRFWEAELLRQTGVLQLSTGAADDAAATINQALTTARSQGAMSLYLRAALSLGETPEQQDAATAALAEAFKGIEAGSTTPDARRAAALLSSANA